MRGEWEAVSTYRIDLPYRTPPLSLNQRHHWSTKARLTRQCRHDAHLLAAFDELPRHCAHVTVALHYAPMMNYRLDADNIVATLKALCDGLVDYGLTADDTPEYMTKLMPIIHPKSPTGHGEVWLEIEVTQ